MVGVWAESVLAKCNYSFDGFRRDILKHSQSQVPTEEGPSSRRLRIIGAHMRLQNENDYGNPRG